MFIHLFLGIIVLLANQVLANTETITFKVPNYYDIPFCLRSFHNLPVTRINSSTLLLTDIPIRCINNYTIDDSVISLPYDYIRKPKQTLLVKLNNYENAAFDSNDLINVKLCWPATYPINFNIDYKYVRASEFEKSHNDTLDIYVEVTFYGDFYSPGEVKEDKIQFQLIISRLPGVVPIPIELYDFIIYVVTLLFLLVPVYPYIVSLLTAPTSEKEHED